MRKFEKEEKQGMKNQKIKCQKISKKSEKIRNEEHKKLQNEKKMRQ